MSRIHCQTLATWSHLPFRKNARERMLVHAARLPKSSRFKDVNSHRPRRSVKRSVATPVPPSLEPETYGEDDSICEVTVQRKNRVKPGSVFQLARNNLDLTFGGIGDSIEEAVLDIGHKLLPSLIDERPKPMPECMGFELDDDLVMRRGEAHERAEDEPALIRLFFEATIKGLDLIYSGKPIQRFWVLEVIARIPYFSYVAVLHLYESLGWWQDSDLAKVHFAEAYAEQHHLLIMEALGGGRRWSDRFVAQHTALVYYWAVCAGYLVSPKWSYYFMQLVEQHAADTYSQFVEENGQLLESLPPPEVAVDYYRDGDLYMFDEFQSTRAPLSRRPPVDNLLQVFENVRDDEMEHIKTLVQCQDYEFLASQGISPHSRYQRGAWISWADEINSQSSDGKHTGRNRSS